jgi:hypothetical protein
MTKPGRAIKILMVNHPDCQRYRGGDLVQMRNTAEVLRGCGVTCAESCDPIVLRQR